MNISKLFGILLVFLCSFAIAGCDDDNNVDVEFPDTKLIKGQWQLVDDTNTDNALVYRFTTDTENTWSWGGLMTYYLSTDGTVTYDKRYTWHVSDPVNEEDGRPRIELSWFVTTENDDIWEATEYYLVIKLTPSEMWMKRAQNGLPADIKKFIRRDDLPTPPKHDWD